LPAIPKIPLRWFKALSFLQNDNRNAPQQDALMKDRRVSGVTSDISLGGCFVCARRTLDVSARVRVTLTHQGQKVKMLTVVRVVRAQVGMGLEFLDIDPESNATLLAWIENLRKSR